MFIYTGHWNLQARIYRLKYYGSINIFTLYSWYLKQTYMLKINGDKLNLGTFYSIWIYK
jgi:hypothetical protein